MQVVEECTTKITKDTKKEASFIISLKK